MSLEDQLRGVTALLHEQQQETLEVQAMRERAQRMFAELEESKRCRKAFQGRAERLQALFERERNEREAWLESFTKELQNTLAELEASVEQGITDSAKAMQGRLDQADGVMEKLLQRVNQIFGPGGGAAAAPAAAVPPPPAMPPPPAVTPPCVRPRPQGQADPQLGAGPSPSSRQRPLDASERTPSVGVAERLAQAISSPRSQSGRPPQASSSPLGSGSLAASTASSPLKPAAADDALSQTASSVGKGSASVEATDILKNWTELLNENLVLQQRQSQLLQKKQQVSLRAHSASSSPKPIRNFGGGPRSLPQSCVRSPVSGSPSSGSALGTRPRLPMVQEQCE